MAGRIAVIGEDAEIGVYRDTDMLIYMAEDPEAVLAAWRSLPEDIGVVIVTAAAAICIEAVDANHKRQTIILPMQARSRGEYGSNDV